MGLVGEEGGNINEGSFKKLNKAGAVEMARRLTFPSIFIDEFKSHNIQVMQSPAITRLWL